MSRRWLEKEVKKLNLEKHFVFEGLTSGDKYGSAVGIAALILVVGGAFGIIMQTGAIDAGIFAFINKTKGLERLALPMLFFAFSFH